MSAISNITVFDGAATPVSHTLVPVSVSRDKPNRVRAEWRETGLAVPTDAQPRLTITVEKLNSGVFRAERKLEIPVMESVSGQNAAGYTAAPRVAHVLTDHHNWLFSPRSDVVSRRLIRQMGVNIDGNVSTSVAAATSGPISELVDLLVAPT